MKHFGRLRTADHSDGAGEGYEEEPGLQADFHSFIAAPPVCFKTSWFGELTRKEKEILGLKYGISTWGNIKIGLKGGAPSPDIKINSTEFCDLDENFCSIGDSFEDESEHVSVSSQSLGIVVGEFTTIGDSFDDENGDMVLSGEFTTIGESFDDYNDDCVQPVKDFVVNKLEENYETLCF